MLDDKIMYKILLYVTLGSIIYLMCRYLPFTDMTALQSINVCIILVVIILGFDFAISKFWNKSCDSSNLLDDLTGTADSCKSCQITPSATVEGFESTRNDGKKQCRIVCDDDEKPQTEPIIKETVVATEQKNPPVEISKYGNNGGVDDVGLDPQEKGSTLFNNKKCSWLSPHEELSLKRENAYGHWDNFDKDVPDWSRTIEDHEGELVDARSREEREKAYVNTLKQRMDDRATKLDGYSCPYQKVGSRSKLNYLEKGRRIAGDLDDELPYTDYNHLPVASGYKSHDYEYGWSFLPPEKWYPQPPRPPICVTEKRCPVMPTLTEGAPVDVKEFHSSRKILPPALINTEYIRDHLNDGY